MRLKINKKNLIIYFIFLIGGIVLASFYGGPFAYGILYALLLLIPVSIVYILINYSSLRIFQEVEVHKLTKGEIHQYRIILENAGFLPLHEMLLENYPDRCILYDIEDKQQLSLKSFEKKELVSGINCLYAGAYNVGLEKVSFSDPFKLFSLQFQIPYTFRAIVSPRITNIADDVLDLENLVNSAGLKSENLYEDTPGSDMRTYQNGDPITSINWKVSARLSELVVRVPEKMEKRTLTILMDAAYVPREEQGQEYLKKRDFFLEFIVSAAWHFGKQGVPVKLIYPSGKRVDRIVDSYDSFMDFYNVVADGIFYDSKKSVADFKQLTDQVREHNHENDTWIILKEDSDREEDFLTICG